MNQETELEELTIIQGKFSQAGNFLGICLEKEHFHAPLHIYKAQMQTLGWNMELDNVELPFFALGRWKEIANKPGEFRFTAQKIYKTYEEYLKKRILADDYKNYLLNKKKSILG
jgi:hypothetical protein